MEFDLPTIVFSVLALLWTSFGGIATRALKNWFDSRADNEWIVGARNLLMTIVESIDQDVGRGVLQPGERKLAAVNRATSAIKASKPREKAVIANAGSVDNFVEREIEAAVNRKKAFEKAAEARSVHVGPR